MMITSVWLLLPLLLLGPEASAQAGYLWSAGELTATSDLVVIASRVATRDTGFRGRIANLRPPFPVVELNTEFKVLSILKGRLAGGSFVLRHYRRDTDRSQDGVTNGAHALEFAAADSAAEYLLFLKRDADGMFVPVSGEIFPEESVFGLRKAG